MSSGSFRLVLQEVESRFLTNSGNPAHFEGGCHRGTSLRAMARKAPRPEIAGCQQKPNRILLVHLRVQVHLTC